MKALDCLCSNCNDGWDRSHWIECNQCKLHGHPDDDFTIDSNKEVCNTCCELTFEEMCREEDT